jgi:hypothetical protein
MSSKENRNTSEHVEMVDAMIDLLRKERKNLTSLLIIGDTEDKQIVQLLGSRVSRQELQSMIGAMELVKSRILTMLTEDDDEDEDELADRKIRSQGRSAEAEKTFNDLLNTLRNAKIAKKGDKDGN